MSAVETIIDAIQSGRVVILPEGIELLAIKEFEERVKALEKQYPILLNALNSEPALRIDYIKAFNVEPVKTQLIESEPAPRAGAVGGGL